MTRTPLWRLSFVDASRPTGQQFLGACIVPGENMVHAVKAAHILGCNPGGEVRGFEIPWERYSIIMPAEIGKLFSREECERFGRREAGNVRGREISEGLRSQLDRLTALLALAEPWVERGRGGAEIVALLAEVRGGRP